MSSIAAINPTKALKVTDYLAAVNYSGDTGYVPSTFSLEMVSFIKLIDGGMTENITPTVHLKMLDSFIDASGMDVINLCHRGMAKALCLDTRIPTPNGFTVMGDLCVGDTVFDEHGKPCKVTHKSQIHHKPMYRLSLADGRHLDVCEDHINVVIHRRQKRIDGRRINYLDRRELTTKELLDIPLIATRSKTGKNPRGQENRVWIPLNSCVEYPQKTLPIDPYTLGLILGDGSINKDSGYARLHGHKDDLSILVKHVPYEQGSTYIDKRNPSVLTVGFKGTGNAFKSLGLNVHGDFKFIPVEYLISSTQQRLALLQGLMDTDGTINANGSMSFCSNSVQLIEGVAELVRSLGGIAKIAKNTDKSWRVYIQIDLPIFKLPRKLNRQTFVCPNKIPIVSLERIQDKPSQCIAVDSPEHTYLAGDYVVTHNTTLLEYLIFRIAMYGELPNLGKIPHMIFVGDTIDGGVKKMRKALEYRFNNSEFLQQYLQELKFTDIRWEFIRKDGTSLVVSAYGGKTNIRGTRENGSRPVLALLDDIITDADARSPTEIENIRTNINNSLEAALHPKRRKIIWNGTPFNAADPLYIAVESGAWLVNVYPICEKFPCTAEEFKGSWEDRFDFDYVQAMYNKLKLQGALASFYQELMLRILSDDTKLIQDSDIKWYSRKALLNNKANFNFYITTDFATSEKQHSDFSFISVWAVNNKGFKYWVDGICKRQTMDKNLNDLFRLVQIYSPQSVGIEVSGQQGGFINWIEQEMMHRNIYFSLASESNDGKAGIRPTTSKLQRFNIVVPYFKKGEMFFPIELRGNEALEELLEELGLTTVGGFKSKKDDGLDTVSMLALMPIWLPGESYEFEQDRGGIWGIAAQEAHDNSSYFC